MSINLGDKIRWTRTDNIERTMTFNKEYEVIGFEPWNTWAIIIENDIGLLVVKSKDDFESNK